MFRSILTIAAAASMFVVAGCAHNQHNEADANSLHNRGPLTASAARANDVTDNSAATTTNNRDNNSALPGAVYFGFNDAELSGAATSDLDKVGQKMMQSSGSTIRIEGNCDERGTTEYNMALGNQRAESARTYLQRLGVAKSRIRTISYGSERPKNPGHDEGAWQENRRDDLVLSQ